MRRYLTRAASFSPPLAVAGDDICESHKFLPQTAEWVRRVLGRADGHAGPYGFLTHARLEVLP